MESQYSFLILMSETDLVGIMRSMNLAYYLEYLLLWFRGLCYLHLTHQI